MRPESQEIAAPVPYVSLPPLAARYYAQRITVRELRAASIHAREHGRVRLAEELDAVSAQMRHVLAAASGGSVVGSAEVVLAEVDAGLEGPASSDSWGTARVAEELGCSPRWVSELIERGQLEATRVGRTWVVDRESVEDYKTARGS